MNKKLRLLDLFCGAGGAAMGYYRAGFFDITGVDIAHQKRFPFRFVQADALEYLERLIKTGEIEKYDLVHTSPPCQAYSITANLPNNSDHPMLIEPTRDLLVQSSRPYVIENVEGSPLINPVILCGSMFAELRVYRHRLFECNPPVWFPPMACNHSYSMPASKGAYHTLDKQEFITCVGHSFQAESGRIAMQIDWMTRDEIAQAIPPAYTEYIGKQIIEML